jgi:protein-S-isoprenylcysteine O-methyltransferase Ste14
MKHCLGSEHPLWDRVQLLIVILFFAVWGIYSVGFFVFRYSTVIFEATSFPWLLAGPIVTLALSFYIVSKSHKTILEQVHNPHVLEDSGVYAWVRHLMCLGILLFLAFIFVNVSLISIGIWIGVFVFYDRMATYEEKSLIEILGEPYIAYQKQVSKLL